MLEFIVCPTKNLIDKPVVRDEQNVIHQFPHIRVSSSNYLYNNATLSNKHYPMSVGPNNSMQI